MARANPEVMEMIEKEIRANPEISNPELLDKAKAIDKSVGKLSLARDVADAQGKGELVDVVAGIDRYVDRVLKAAR